MAETASRISRMSNMVMSASVPAPRASTGTYNFAIAATLLGFALVLIAAQLIFVGNNPDVLEAAARDAALGIIAP
jgi:energy-converting hydrogenase Eha subunit B